MKRFACLAFVLVAACGDDGSTTIDAAAIDAANIDAAVDAPIDAAPTVYSGTFTALEVALLNPGMTTFFGQGMQVGITFGDSVTGIAPIMEEQPGSPLGCKLFQFNAAQTRQAVAGNDEGTVQVTVTGGTTPATPPVFPMCKFTANVGYNCVTNNTAGTGGGITANPNMTATLTVAPPGVFTEANSLGSYVQITGATQPANNGVFPIVARPAGNVIVYANPVAQTEAALPAAATHVNIAGVGPIPGKADPGFLADDSTLTFTVTPGGGSHFAAFTSTTAPGTVGDDFTLPVTELAKLSTFPQAAGPLTVGCADAASCGNASGTLINIITTDAPTAGISPFAMPLPVTKRIQVRCAALGATSVTVPAAYMAAVNTAGVTRIQTTFMRPTLMSGGPATTNSLSGHAIVGITTR